LYKIKEKLLRRLINIMQRQIRTDFAIEAKELWHENASITTKLRGVIAKSYTDLGFNVDYVEILDNFGAEQLGKPIGKYFSIDIDDYINHENGTFSSGITVISNIICRMLSNNKSQSVLVVGLGNSAITPDNLGPQTIKSIIVTRHLVDKLPKEFGDFSKVSAIKTGVLGTTGIESLELVHSIVSKIQPDIVLAIDSLVSRKLSRVCRTIQLNDSGIIPGSGVGNSRLALNKATLGIPVIAIGLATVVNVGTLISDLQVSDNFEETNSDMIVTPKEIDTYINEAAKLIGYSINKALHRNMTEDDISSFLS
jgi:spore protease